MFSLVTILALSASDLVEIKDGLIRGSVTGHSRSFKGIPFAAPPLKKLRWAPPAPVEPWGDTLNATSYRHNCLQTPSFVPAQPRETLSEDCLYLNVFTPASANATSKLPVIFWVHGGSYQSGGSNETRLNGTWNAGLFDVVMVVTNYRLNVFGFLGSDTLRAKDPRGGTGNYGILDQRAALQWVQTNIAAFGGDPTRVLLAGESAGGASVYNHLAQPGSWGLFSRAAAESGGYTFILPNPEPSDFEGVFQTLLHETNCTNLACLEDYDADALFRASLPYCNGVNCTPCVDGVDLTDQIHTLFKQGKVAPNVPLMAGATREDLAYPLWPAADVRMKCSPFECTESDFADFLARLQPAFQWSDAQARQVQQAYSSEVALPSGNASKWYWAAHHMGSDFCMICTARRSAAQLAAGTGAPTYVYLFAHTPDGPSGQYPELAHHASEIPFVFHVNDSWGPSADEYRISVRERPLSDLMAGAWVTFAATGAPPTNWPPYSANSSWFVFGDVHGGPSLGGHAQQQLKHLQCEIWDAAPFGASLGIF